MQPGVYSTAASGTKPQEHRNQMTCNTCHHFTPIHEQDENGYCDWLKSPEALLMKIPTAIERLHAIGILMDKGAGEACRAYKPKRRK
jgi:hypothetical protein